MTTKSQMSVEEKKSVAIKLVTRLSMLPVILGLLLYLPAGTLDFWQAHVYLIVLLSLMLFALLYFLKNDPRLLERRSRFNEKEKTQILVILITLPAFVAEFLVSGLDFRYKWSNMPLYVVITGFILVIAGYIFVLLVFKQNSYASRTVEVDKKQQVVTTGLYSFIRHPMYLGVIVMYLASPVALGSYWGVLPAAVVLPPAIIARIINEEKVLTQNLDGYREYCQQTKYRLIPLVW